MDLVLPQILNTEVISVDTLSQITGWKKETIYKKTSAGVLPYYRPCGAKNIFFKKAEIEEWLLTNRQPTRSELEKSASRKVKELV